MGFLILCCVFLLGCARPEPAQDPLSYLRIGVNPGEEAAAIIRDLELDGYQIGRRIDGRHFVAFDATRGPDSTVRVVTSRGPALSIHVPDVRWPERLWVELSGEARPDFDRDGQRDVVVVIRERERTCLAWAQVHSDGFVAEVFRPRVDWGESPCVVEIDPTWPRLLLEVDVPDASVPASRVRIPIRAAAREWVLDDSTMAIARWDRELGSRKKALRAAETTGDPSKAIRLRAEIEWLEQLRKGKPPVLEPASDGEEAR